MPLPLSEAEVESLRALVVDLAMPDPYTIRGVSLTDDLAGGDTAGEPTDLEYGMCRFRPYLGRSEQVIASQLAEIASAAVDLPYATVCDPEHTIEIGGRIFQVRHVSRGGAWEMTATALVDEVT